MQLNKEFFVKILNKETFKKIIGFLNTRTLTNILFIILLLMLYHAWVYRGSIGSGDSNYVVEEELKDLNRQISTMKEALNDIKYDVGKLKSYASY